MKSSLRIPASLAIVGIVLLTTASLVPSASATRVTVVYPPWWSAERAVAAAAATGFPILRFGLDGRVAVLDIGSSLNGRQRAGSGAWFVATEQFALLCGVRT